MIANQGWDHSAHNRAWQLTDLTLWPVVSWVSFYHLLLTTDMNQSYSSLLVTMGGLINLYSPSITPRLSPLRTTWIMGDWEIWISSPRVSFINRDADHKKLSTQSPIDHPGQRPNPTWRGSKTQVPQSGAERSLWPAFIINSSINHHY